ncbi:MAG: MgtC/SapB family protein [Xanthobacteraceae bacterium]
MSTFEVFIRLLAAMLSGAALGLNRDLHSKPTGIRTLGLVGLGSALAVMAGSELGGDGDATRVMQGIVTGIGFLGAGVIVRPAAGMSVHGLTTAACTWLTACLGIVCAVGAWRIVIIGLLLTFVILFWGGPLEKMMRRNFRPAQDDPLD